MTREIETWLSDSRVGISSLVDHRNRRPIHCVIAEYVLGKKAEAHWLSVVDKEKDLAVIVDTSLNV